MRRALLRKTIVHGVLALPLVLCAAVALQTPASATPIDDESRDLVRAYASTVAFRDVRVAQLAGWPEDTTGCIEFPDGYLGLPPGGMGHHYTNPELLADGGDLDPRKPEALVYETRPDGSLRLNAVEYIVPEQDLPRTAEPPELFGQKFTFHEGPQIWALHVWLYRDNPYGLYAHIHPDVTCEHAAR
ncbi:MAG TPA: hypothetical protein VI076_17375 [Actinopolymorphaceae bacterium]